MDTLLLSVPAWDLTIDVDGNIAVAHDVYSIAQDVASAARTFLGEVWYNTLLGMPYFQNILGELPPLGFLVAKYTIVGEQVPEVQSIAVALNPITRTRQLTGSLTITNQQGVTAVVIGTVGGLWYVSGVTP